MKQIPKERNVSCVAHPEKASVDLTDTIWREEMALVKVGLPWWLSGKETTCQCRRCGFYSWVGKIPWRSKQQPTPVFLPGKSHGQRSLADHKESDMTERLNNNWTSARTHLSNYLRYMWSKPGRYWVGRHSEHQEQSVQRP